MNPDKIAAIELPSDIKPVLEALSTLRLLHWKQALMSDMSNIKPMELKLFSTYLQKWATTEISERHSKAIHRRVEAAKFIRIQTVDQFDFKYNPSTRGIESTFIKLHRATLEGKIPRAVFVGNTGLGKTHLSRSLGYAACQANLSVLFTRASQIVNQLATAKALHNLERELKKYRKPQLLIVDELGYVTMDTEAGNLFFQVVSDRHDRGLGTIVTTNYAFGHWNQIFSSNSTALVTVERLTAEAEVFFLEGESYPQHQRKKIKSKQKMT